MNKIFTLCADDFAQNAAISEAILELLIMRRLSATSVFSQSASWPALAPELGRMTDIDVGLHFNLTEPMGDLKNPLAYWLAASQIHSLSVKKLADALRRQIDAFSNSMGRLPDFIDGHQHVHAFPQIRNALFSTLPQYDFSETRPYLRAPDRLAHSGDSRFKANIMRFACSGFSDAAQANGFAVPRWFGGVYSLKPNADYRKLMRSWLKNGRDGALLMCHPGRLGADDAIAAARYKEFQYLRSEFFIEDCIQAGVKLGRFRQ